jgi:hypothetical protein
MTTKFYARSEAFNEARSRADRSGRPFRICLQSGIYHINEASEPFEGKEIAVVQPDPRRATLNTQSHVAAPANEAREAQPAMPAAADIYAQRRAAVMAKAGAPEEPVSTGGMTGAPSGLPDPAEVYARRAATVTARRAEG